jgi:hypothetical protein
LHIYIVGAEGVSITARWVVDGIHSVRSHGPAGNFDTPRRGRGEERQLGNAGLFYLVAQLIQSTWRCALSSRERNGMLYQRPDGLTRT